MLNNLKNKIMMNFDPVYDHSKIVQIGEKIDTDFNLKFSGNRTVLFEQLLNTGPVLLIFIKGTWCPFCRLHLQKLRQWAETVNAKVTTIVISSEDIETINKWLKDNPVTYMFASDKHGDAARRFRIWLDEKNYSQAATFLVDVDKSVRFAYAGKRDKKMEEMTPPI